MDMAPNCAPASLILGDKIMHIEIWRAEGILAQKYPEEQVFKDAKRD